MFELQTTKAYLLGGLTRLGLVTLKTCVTGGMLDKVAAGRRQVAEGGNISN